MIKRRPFLLLVPLVYTLSAMIVQSSHLDSLFQDTPRTDPNRLAKISGRVLDAEGKPAFQMEIRVTKAEEVEANPDAIFAEQRRFTYIDQNGNYELQWVPPGRYIITVNADHRFEYPVTYYPNTQDIVRAIIITVEQSDDLKAADIVLPAPTLRRREVKGLVTHGDGRPASGAEVRLLLAKYPWSSPTSATTDNEGHFSVTGFEGIDYLLHAWVNVGRDQQIHAEPATLQFKADMEPITLTVTLPGKGLPIQKKN